MHFDPTTGVVTMEQAGVVTSGRGLHAPAPLVQDGTPNSGPAESVELVTTSALLPGQDFCGPTSNCFTIDLNSFLSRPATGVALVIDAASPSRQLGFSDAAPPGSGLSSAYGLRSFGDVPAGGTVTRSLEFTVPNSDPYTVVFSLWEQDTGTRPANDDPAGAIALTPGADFAAGAIVGSNVGATASELFDGSIPVPGCASYSGGDVWYSVVVPASGNLSFETALDGASTLNDTGLAIYSGSVGALSLVACDDDSSADFFSLIQRSGLTAGDTIFVRVWEFGGGTQDTFQVSAWEQVPPPPPANDDSPGAVGLTVGPDFATNAVVGTNVGATRSELVDPSIPAPGCGNYQGGDVWFSAVVPASGRLAFETDGELGSTLGDSAIAVYSFDMGTWGLVGCDDDGGIGNFSRVALSGLSAGDTLFLRVWGPGNAVQDAFQVSAIEPPAAPANDEPAGAVGLSVGTDFASNAVLGTNVAATASEVLDPSIPDPGCANYAGGDVWFSVVVPASGELRLETDADVGSPLGDTGLAAYDGAFGLLGCNDDDGNGLFSQLDLTGLTPGATVLVRVWEYDGGTEGTFQVSAYPPVAPPPPPLPPANDDPSGATAMSVGPDFPTNAIVSTNLAATASEVGDPTIPPPSCSSYAGGDVWFSVEVPASGNVTLETALDGASTLTDTAIVAYTGAIGSFVEVGCDDDSSADFFSLLSLTGLTPTDTIFVRVFRYNSSVGDTFQISAYDAP